MIEYWATQLDDVAREDDRPSFHVFAEGMHSDVRGEIFALTEEAPLSLPHIQWPHHLFIVIGISGKAEARFAGRMLEVRPFSQLVVLPGVACQLRGAPTCSIELISLLSMRPVTPDAC